MGIRLGSCFPLGSYNDLTQIRGGSPNTEPIYSASLDYFWKHFGVGIESGFFSQEYHQAPYTSLTYYNVTWENRDWSNFFIFLGPSYSLSTEKVQFQIAAKAGIMNTQSPTYESMFTITHPDILSFEYPSNSQITPYGSLSLITNFLVTKNISLSLSVAYTRSIGEDFNYSERELIDYDGDGTYSLEETKASSVIEKSIDVESVILQIGLGINYRFL